MAATHSIPTLEQYLRQGHRPHMYHFDMDDQTYSWCPNTGGYEPIRRIPVREAVQRDLPAGERYDCRYCRSLVTEIECSPDNPCWDGEWPVFR